MNRLTQFRDLFRFREDIRLQSSKFSYSHSLKDYADSLFKPWVTPQFEFLLNIAIGFHEM